MEIGFLKSTDPRCPISATSAKKFAKLGVNMLIQTGLGKELQLDLESLDRVSDKTRDEILSSSDIVYSSDPLDSSELAKLKSDAVLVSFYAPFNSDNKVGTLNGHKIHAFSMDMIPRTTLAQSMDVLSSMASIAGYKAVLTAAQKLPRYFPMLMTAAGTVKPATVLVLGAGVAGLQAIATAMRLGAKVEAFDVRKAVKEEVEGLGAKFIEVEGSTDDKEAGGYAVEQTEEYKRKQSEKIAERVANADVVITTAQLRGRPAPTLVTKDMVDKMKYGSVIIDLAASTGGNCALTEGETTVDYNGIQIIGDSHLENKAIIDASALLSNNIYNYTQQFFKEDSVQIDLENEIIAKSRIYTHETSA
jgi:NAD(P) transhydrogenase subunit alpha